MVVKMLPFRNFKEKIKITKKYDKKAKMQVVDNKYIYMVMKNEDNKMGYYNNNNELAGNYHK